MMKKVVALALSAAMMLSLAACGGSSGSATSETSSAASSQSEAAQSEATSEATSESTSSEETPAAEASGEPIVIGAVDATSGGSAPMGLPARNGLELAVAECNEAGGINGRPIKLITYDNEADAAKSATEVTKLIEEDGAILVITGSNSGICNSDKYICEEAGVVNLCSIGTADTVIDDPQVFYNTFRVGAPESYLQQLLGFVCKDAGYQKVGVIADTSGYGQTAVTTIQEIFQELGVPIEIVVQHENGTSDLTAQVLQMKNADCDAVVSYNLGADAALTVKTMADLDWKVPTYGGRGLNMQSFVELVGEYGEGVIFPCDSDMNAPKLKAFIEKYLAAGYEEMSNYMFPAMGYATMQIAIEALTRANGEGGDALRDAFESIQDFQTVLGQEDAVVSYSPTKHEAVVTGRDVLNSIKDGAFIMVEEFPYEEPTDRYEENY